MNKILTYITNTKILWTRHTIHMMENGNMNEINTAGVLDIKSINIL